MMRYLIIALMFVASLNATELSLPDDPTHEQPFTFTVPPVDAMGFIEPLYSSADTIQVASFYPAVSGVNQEMYAKTMAYFNANQSRIANKTHVGIIDFSRNSKYARFHIINVKTGSVRTVHVAHGSGSDTNNDGFAERFSNKSGSHASSIGFYLTGETYHGGNGLSRRLDGLSSTNSNARGRLVVIHGSDYVHDRDVRPGRSWGCPAVSRASLSYVINTLDRGSLIYAGN